MTRVSSGAPWESRFGYSRAIASGPYAAVAGTTATVNGVVIGEDAYTQAMIAFSIGIDALRALGFEVHHVIRTRMYVMDIKHQDDVGRAHHELFARVMPAATMVQVAALALPEHLVEIELDAYAGA